MQSKSFAHLFTAVFALFTASQAIAATTNNALTDVPVPCNPADQTYVGQQFKLVQQPGARKVGNGGSVTTSGVLTVVDGCTFTVSNFVFSPPAGQPYWYGISAKDNTNLWKANGGVIGVGAGTSFTWTLNGVSWSQLAGLGIYSEQYNTFIGIACFSGTCDWNGQVAADAADSGASALPVHFVLKAAGAAAMTAAIALAAF